ncbi:MAG: CDP-alcohol phosphatidyltransferase family protein [Alphaproteobacteria bacterium]|nr:CDP-alcohol phosphatidyltransferase family protein [Alphaproteobacteria bacterium]
MDYFNEEERVQQQKFAAWRDRALAPVISILLSLHLTPNRVTILAVLCLIGGVLIPPFQSMAFQSMAWIAISILLFSYCVLDGFDGPLARKMGKSHQGGAIVDMAADQIGIPLVAAAAAFHWNVDPWSAVIFSASYISFIMLAVYANQHNIKIWAFLRVKYFYYFLYCVSALLENIFSQNWYLLVWATPIFAVYYSFFTFHALKRIYDHYDNAHNTNNKA